MSDVDIHNVVIANCTAALSLIYARQQTCSVVKDSRWCADPAGAVREVLAKEAEAEGILALFRELKLWCHPRMRRCIGMAGVLRGRPQRPQPELRPTNGCPSPVSR